MQLDKPVSVIVQVYSTLGQLIETKNFGKQSGRFSQDIDFSNYSNGVYLLQIKADNIFINKKIIKHE